MTIVIGFHLDIDARNTLGHREVARDLRKKAYRVTRVRCCAHKVKAAKTNRSKRNETGIQGVIITIIWIASEPTTQDLERGHALYPIIVMMCPFIAQLRACRFGGYPFPK